MKTNLFLTPAPDAPACDRVKLKLKNAKDVSETDAELAVGEGFQKLTGSIWTESRWKKSHYKMLKNKIVVLYEWLQSKTKDGGAELRFYGPIKQQNS